MAVMRGYLEPFVIPRGQVSHQAAAEGLNQIGLKAFTLLTQTLTLMVRSSSREQASVLKSRQSHEIGPLPRDSPSSLSGKVKICLRFPEFVFREDTAGNVITKQIMKPMVWAEEGKEPRGLPAALQ